MAIMRRDPFRAIERWEPFREMESLRREMDRLFDRLVPGAGEAETLAFMPSAEMEETEDAIRIKLEIPGIDPEDLNVEVTEDRVSITGERKSEMRTEEKGMIRSEFRYGRFERQIPLPSRIQSDQVQAEYKNGLLHLHLPKSEEEKKKIVKVNISQ